MKATITTTGDAATLKDLFAAEDKELSNQRASYVVTSTDKGVRFDITASDAVALRATLTAITKLLEIYEKMGDVQ